GRWRRRGGVRNVDLAALRTERGRRAVGDLTERRRQIGRRGQRLRHREQYLRALDVLALFGEAQRGVDGRPAGRGDFARGGEMARGERPAASKGREQTQSNAAR